MRGIVGIVIAIIGGIYAIGLAIHFWWVIVAALIIIWSHKLITEAKTTPPRTTTAPVNTSQARYSNRR